LKIIGVKGVLSGVLASIVFLILDFIAVLNTHLPQNTLLIDFISIILTGAILGFVFNIIEKPLIFLDARVKAEGYGLIIGLLLGLNGRVQLLTGTGLYNVINSVMGIPFIIDLVIGIIAGLIWGTVMGMTYWLVAYRGKKTMTQSLKDRITGLISGQPREEIRQTVPPKKLSLGTLLQKKQPIIVQGNYKVCPKCGTLNKPEAKFCIKCGYRLV